MKLKITIAGALAGLFLASGPVPSRAALRYTGSLVDSGGQAQNGAFLLKFRLFDGSGGRELWNAAKYVRVNQGLFSADLAVPEGLSASPYQLRVEAPAGTGWTAAAAAPASRVEGAPPAKPAPTFPRPRVPETAGIPDAGSAMPSPAYAKPSSPEIVELKKEIAKTRSEAKKAEAAAKQSQERLNAIEEDLKKNRGLERTGPKIYTVRTDDTLRSIAEKVYKDPERWIDIYQANHDRLQRGGELSRGQKLIIPD